MELDPELKNQLVEFLKALLANAQDAGTWAKAQIPILVQEKIAYGRALETIEFAVSLGIFITALLCIRRALKRGNAFNVDASSADMATLLVVVFGSIIGTITLCINTPSFIQVWFAPRLYIVDWLIGIVKNVKG